MSKPVVAIVGRPNVGKSTLFNKLVGARLSIVDDTPGVTRDRIYGDCEWGSRTLLLVDTGGIEPYSDDIILKQMRRQAQLAIDSADVIILVTDVRSGVVSTDSEVASMLQKSGKPIVLCVNKCDTVGEPPAEYYEFYNLGLGDPIAVSSVHGMGTGDLLDAVCEHLPPADEEEEEDDPDVSVGFNKQVTLEDGLYFKEGLQDFETVRQELVGVKQAQKVYTVKAGDTLWSIAHNNDLTFRELCALNPAFKGEPLSETSSILEGDHLVITKEEAGLEVRITRIETREEEIAFSTETTKSNEYTKGTTKVLQEGENGLRRVTLQNVYDTKNILVDQSVLSTEVIKEPVNKKVVEGTKKVTSSTKYITGSGRFIWPVPNYRYCSRWYGGRHRGVDICAPAGTPIYASAGGTVTKAGYNKAGAGTGYGYSVIINHGGGYSSVYAHCLSLTVSAGQTVKQGQLIGYLGSTGRSTGNHCHFEIRLNGSYIPPQNVFPGKK